MQKHSQSACNGHGKGNHSCLPADNCADPDQHRDCWPLSPECHFGDAFSVVGSKGTVVQPNCTQGNRKALKSLCTFSVNCEQLWSILNEYLALLQTFKSEKKTQSLQEKWMYCHFIWPSFPRSNQITNIPLIYHQPSKTHLVDHGTERRLGYILGRIQAWGTVSPFGVQWLVRCFSIFP